MASASLAEDDGEPRAVERFLCRSEHDRAPTRAVTGAQGGQLAGLAPRESKVANSMRDRIEGERRIPARRNGATKWSRAAVAAKAAANDDDREAPQARVRQCRLRIAQAPRRLLGGRDEPARRTRWQDG